jgi:hypothetical protein
LLFPALLPRDRAFVAVEEQRGQIGEVVVRRAFTGGGDVGVG